MRERDVPLAAQVDDVRHHAARDFDVDAHIDAGKRVETAYIAR